MSGTADARQEHVRDAEASGYEPLASDSASGHEVSSVDPVAGRGVDGAGHTVATAGLGSQPASGVAPSSMSAWAAGQQTVPVPSPAEHDPEAHGPNAVLAAPPAPGSRAGRNLPAALAVGFGLGLSLIAILLFVPKVFIGVVGVAVGVATWEVVKRLREADVLVPRIPLIVGGQAVFWLGWPYGASGVTGAFAATALTCMVWRLFDHGLQTAPRNFLRDTAIAIFTLAWIPLLASFATLLLLEPDGNLRVLTFMILVVCSDVGGYVAGVLFGRHPMVPSISPKKSWEGFGGSLVFSVIGGLLTVTLLLDANSMIGVVLGIGLVLVATCGDLIESQIKRELGIKDMGTLLPGHGGIMDRLDSMLPSAFVSWLVLSTLL
ncbi:phosphatidate cytidylyltransferase [Nocardia tenerifensis]|uniref:Phosphatidate cytidylyltransferase n=2 Tax=Nocardia tenerifensis TaxID=228006 RepID=A0A318JZ46_9NOCA|nr:phosphatidate cytidylyltransferase [Nocardia tenerifensis]